MVPVKTKSNTYRVTQAYSQSGSIYFKADGLPCEDYPELCVKYMINDLPLHRGDFIKVRIDKGIGGYQVIKCIESIGDPTSLEVE